MDARAILQVEKIRSHERRAVVGDGFDGALELRRLRGEARARWGSSARRRECRRRSARAPRAAAAAGEPCPARESATRLRPPWARSCRPCSSRALRQLEQHVLVAHHHRSLGDHADGRARVRERFERPARQLVVTFDRLVDVGGGARPRRTRASTTADPALLRARRRNFFFTRMTDENSSPLSSSNCT